VISQATRRSRRQPADGELERAPQLSPVQWGLLALFAVCGIGLTWELAGLSSSQPRTCERAWKADRTAALRARPDLAPDQLEIQYMSSCRSSLDFPADVLQPDGRAGVEGTAPAASPPPARP
jgi:hypothetical protein